MAIVKKGISFELQGLEFRRTKRWTQDLPKFWCIQVTEKKQVDRGGNYYIKHIYKPVSVHYSESDNLYLHTGDYVYKSEYRVNRKYEDIAGDQGCIIEDSEESIINHIIKSV